MLAIHPRKVVEKHFATNQIKWQQINKMIGYKKKREAELVFSRNGQRLTSVQKAASTSCGIISE